MKHKIELPSIERLQDKNDLNACYPASAWLGTQTDVKTAWNNCNRSDWLIWVIKETGQMNPTLDLQIQLMALQTPWGEGRKVIDLITDESSKAFIAMKRCRLSGEFISDEDWNAVHANAADAAANAADYAAAAAAAADAAANAAYYADYAATRSFQSNEIRKMITIVD